MSDWGKLFRGAATMLTYIEKAEDMHANTVLWLLLESAYLSQQLQEAQTDADYHGHFHLPGCRKTIYDRKSSPCTCEARWSEIDHEWSETIADHDALREQLQEARDAMQACIEGDFDPHYIARLRKALQESSDEPSQPD